MIDRKRLISSLDLLEANLKAQLNFVRQTQGLLYDCPRCRDKGEEDATLPGGQRQGCRVCGLLPGEHGGYDNDPTSKDDHDAAS